MGDQVETIKFIATILGSMGFLKLVEVVGKWLATRAQGQQDEGAWERGEITSQRGWDRTEVASLRAEVRTLQATVDEWQDRYYHVMTDHEQLKAENLLIRSENHTLVSQITALKLQLQQIQRRLNIPHEPIPGPTAEPPGSGPGLNDLDIKESLQ